MMPYGAFWRAHRRLVRQAFEGTARKEHQPHQVKAVHELPGRLLDTPQRWNEHLRQ